MKKSLQVALEKQQNAPDNPIGFLQAWYLAHCNDEWEHVYGVKIDTIDNPGWSITIDLNDTELEARTDFRKAVNFRSRNKWLVVWKEGSKFEGCGGPNELFKIIELFREWVATPD
jgi:Immunity protein 53